LTVLGLCDTLFSYCDTEEVLMPISLRIPQDKEVLIQEGAAKAGKTKTAFILDAVDEKLHLAQDREQTIRQCAGWLTTEEATELRKDLDAFDVVDEADWR
jgi:uncharacterized protein (DUF1778 family)